MQNKYPLWKYILLVVLAIVGLIYAIPNLYGEDPAIQISAAHQDIEVDATTEKKIVTSLHDAKISFKSLSRQNNTHLLIRFYTTDTQLKAQDVINVALGSEDYVVALNLAPATPAWMNTIGATPMKQGLDLRGGVHLLLEIDINSLLLRRLDGLVKNISQTLREAHIRYSGISRNPKDTTVSLRFRDATTLEEATNLIKQTISNVDLKKGEDDKQYSLVVSFPAAEIDRIRQYTVEQTMTILRNRVNELGVGEAIVQQQGSSRVAVDLPGIQDSARAKQILGGTATLEFRMVDQEHDAEAAKQAGMAPIGSKLYQYAGQPLLLKNQVILSGDSITSAMSSYDQQTGSPAVSIQLSGGESLFTRVTRANIGKLMSIVYVESKPVTKMVNGELVRSSRKEERVISAATIQSALGSNFQITGLKDAGEAGNLALLLRAGALPTALYPIEERMVGPSLGKENIARGLISLQVGLGLIVLLMIVYYRMFGLIANIGLFLNLVLLVAALSLIDTTLTLQGIAAMVLTMGMAVDANVLIYERIREELRNGASPHAAIYAGYERAFATIVDANVTTFIVATILFAIGTGPIRGFAVTLAIGLLTSMLTGVVYTRAIVNLMYGGRAIKKVSVGI